MSTENTSLLEGRIPSFSRDHNKIEPGLYLQERKRNIFVYDLRVTYPNDAFIPISAIHTIEHLFASWLKQSNNRLKDYVVSFNPGGCQTMFYLELFDDLIEQGQIEVEQDFTSLVADVLLECIEWCLSQEEVPGASKEECGNYKSHDLRIAKWWLIDYRDTLTKQFKTV